MRLDKFLSNALHITRSNIPTFIKKNEILVNGKKINKKDFQINENNDEVKVNNEIIKYREFIYYMLNKPKGVVSATIDNLDKTVVELIKTDYDIFPIGRLDKDTEGLLILTNNGQLAHFLTLPNNHVVKKYYCEVDSMLKDEEIKEFENGIIIKDGDEEEFTTKESKLEIVKDNAYYVYISEGKFHQIKRMFWHFKKTVTYLKRISFGDITLDDNLKCGEYRELTDDEIKILKKDFENKR